MHDALGLLIKATIFAMMLSLGVSEPIDAYLSLWRRPGSLLRALLSVVVVFPALVYLLLKLFPLPPQIATGLTVLAASPGAPLTYKRSLMAGGHPTFTASLQLTLALLAIVVTPLTLALFAVSFPLAGGMERLSAVDVARQVSLVQFLPIGIGLLLQAMQPGLVERVRRPLAVAANLMFLGLVAMVLIPMLALLSKVGVVPMMLMAALVLASILAGFVLGSPSLFRQRSALAHNERAAVAIATIARNLGLALLIVHLSGLEQALLPTLLAYAIVGFVVAFPLSLLKRRHHTEAA